MDAEHIEHTGDARELEHPDRDERAGLHERLRRLHRLMRRCHDEALVHDGPLSDTTRGRGRVLAALKMQSPIPTRSTSASSPSMSCSRSFRATASSSAPPPRPTAAS